MKTVWVAVALMISYAALAQQQPLANTPQIKAQLKANNSIEHHEEANRLDGASKKLLPVLQQLTTATQDIEREIDTENSGDKGSEFWPPLRGFRIKITDSLLVIFTAVLAYFTYRLHSSTKKLWETGETQLKLAREEFTTTERAFVFVDGFDTILFTKDGKDGPGVTEFDGKKLENRLWATYFSFQPRWTNAGNTPAIDVRTQVNWKPLDGPLTRDFDYSYSDLPEHHFIGPRAKETSRLISIPTVHALKIIAIQAGTPAILEYGTNPPAAANPSIIVWGRADYFDVFDESHFVEWCYKVNFACPDGRKLAASFTQYGTHNRSGKNDKKHPDPGGRRTP